MDTLEIWKKLQADGYFKKHPDYKLMQFSSQPNNLPELKHVINRTIIEIGCGYGRETVALSHIAKKVIAVDVSEYVLNLNSEFVKLYGEPTNVEYVLAKDFEKIENNCADMVRSNLVFQHIEPERTRQYIEQSRSKLKEGGIVNAQFLAGPKNENPYVDGNTEPSFPLDESEILEFFSDYKIKNKKGQDFGNGFGHLWIEAEK